MIGEYSRLHNSLKEGLVSLGHEVTLVGDGDGFKQYPADYSIEARWCNTKILNIPRQAVVRLFKFDIAKIERALRFYLLNSKLKGFDIVQLINEAPIKTTPSFEAFLLKRIFRQNKKSFVLSCGIDYISARYMLDRKLKYSLMDPFFKDASLKDIYSYIFAYTTAKHKKLHDVVLANVSGIIASDIDYVLPLQQHSKFLGLAPNPVNLGKLTSAKAVTDDQIVIFLGINRWNYIQKGIPYFEDALNIVKEKYGSRIEVIVSENIPYKEYISLYDRADILLDQVYAYDQGYNALEAMAKGKVVFTGAETEFMNHYQLKERVAVNANPNVTELVRELSYLIENPQEIDAISKRARAFIEKEHDHVNAARRYLRLWENDLL